VIVVSNTSPITSLSAIGYVNLLHDIYGTIIIPSAVYEEMTHVGYAGEHLTYASE
jgi:predicted nucleic acid-binding protein